MSPTYRTKFDLLLPGDVCKILDFNPQLSFLAVSENTFLKKELMFLQS